MKKYILLFLFALNLFFSCENKEKYYGEWYLMPKYYNDGSEIFKIKITEDSITFKSDLIIDYRVRYPLTIEKNRFKLLDTTFNVFIENDSLLNINGVKYINHKYCLDIPFYNFEPENKVSINFSKIDSVKKITPSNIVTFIFYGKNPNSGEYSLQLNDKLTTDYEQLRFFLFNSHNNDVILLADKNSKMREIEKIIHEMKYLVGSKLYYICDNKLKIADNNKLHFQLEGITRHISKPFQEEMPLFPLLSFPTRNPSIKNIFDNCYFISLVRDNLYMGMDSITNKDLDTNLYEKITNEEPVFFLLYDGDSTYRRYLEILNIIDKAYDKAKNQKSLNLFNLEYHKLNTGQKEEIDFMILKKSIDDISYQHFKKLNFQIPELSLFE